MGRMDEALAWNVAAQGLSTDPGLGSTIGIGVYVQFGDIDKARSILASTPAEHPLAPLNPGFHLLLDSNYEGAHKFFAEFIARAEQTPPYLYNIAADIAILAGELEKAREYILLQSPILARDSDLQIDRYTVRNIVKLAYIAIENGDVTEGTDMLNATLPVVQSLPRLGMFGQGIRDVRILALLGRKEDALQALQAAIAGGYRSSISFDPWLLENDPFLDSIRDDSRFAAVLDDLEALNEVMRTRVMQAEESGDWATLRSLAGSI